MLYSAETVSNFADINFSLQQPPRSGVSDTNAFLVIVEIDGALITLLPMRMPA